MTPEEAQQRIQTSEEVLTEKLAKLTDEYFPGRRRKVYSEFNKEYARLLEEHHTNVMFMIDDIEYVEKEKEDAVSALRNGLSKVLYLLKSLGIM